MVAYWFLWFYFLIVSLVSIFLNDRKNSELLNNKVIVNFIFLVSVTILIFFAGIRGINTGVDDWMYRGSFVDLTQKINTLSLHQIIDLFKYESLTTIIMYLVSIFTNNSDFFILVYAAISVSLNSYVFKKYSPLILISLAVYSSHLFINKEMNQIRFGMSSALFILSMCLYSNGKLFYSFLFQVLAILAHQTAIAGCVIFMFSFLPMRQYLPLFLVLISVPLGMIGGKVLFGNYFSYLPQNVSNYEGGEFDTEMNLFSLANFKNIIFIFMFCKILYGKENSYKKIEYFALLTYAFGASIRMTFHDFSIIGGRVGNLFLQSEPLLISFFIDKIKSNKYTCSLFIIFILTYYYYYNTIMNPQSIMGYFISDSFKIF